MSHYVCDGTCKSKSDYVGYCQTAGCSHQGQELKACDCEDDHHADILSSVDEDNRGGEDADDFAG